MIRCAQCGHSNLPSFPTCSKCGAALAGGAGAPGAGPQEEYARLAAQRAATGRRNKAIYGIVIAGALGAFAFKWTQDSGHKAEVQAKLDYFGRFADLDKRETGLFWNCIMAGEVDINTFSNANQFQQRIEAAYAAQQKTFSEHIVTECLPKIERAQQAIASLSEPPPEFKAPLDAYKASLPGLQSGINLYAERLKNRGGTKDVDQLIQEYGNAWHSEVKPTPETIAFEKFMRCAVPGLEKMKDAQAMLEFLADTCFKKDPVSFMDRVRKECGPVLQNVDAKAAPANSYKATHKKFYEEEARQLQAWDSCGRKARKGKKAEDLGDFLVAIGDYIKARSEVGKRAKDLAPRK
jgi:hypothetical protein